MSRIGKKEIIIPEGVLVSNKGCIFSVQGKYGALEKVFSDCIKFIISENSISLKVIENTQHSRALHGLTRALVQNMITGVAHKYCIALIAEGVGYKFHKEENCLFLNMGYSHPVKLIIPEAIEVKIESPVKILISGIDKERIGLFASNVRKFRPPEPYKGKGIRYENEKILRKVGKRGK